MRVLASIMGEDSLPEVDRSFLAFGRAFEERMIHQPDRRTLDESMAVGWELLRTLPAAELTRMKAEQIAPPRNNAA